MVLQPQIAQIKGHVERHCFHIIEFRQFYALQNEIEFYRGAPQAAFAPFAHWGQCVFKPT